MILEKVYDELMAQIEDLKKAVAAMGGGGTDDYDDLNNRPKVNNITLSGNKKSSDLKITYSMTEAEYAAATKNAESIYCLQENATTFEEEDETASSYIEWSAGDPSGYVATWVYAPSNQNFTGCTAVECDDAAITVEGFSVVEGNVQVYLSCDDTSQIGETVTFTYTLTQPAGSTRIMKNGVQFGGFRYDVLFTSTGTESSYELSHPYTDYDIIVSIGKYSGATPTDSRLCRMIPTAALSAGDSNTNWEITSEADYLWFTVADATHFARGANNNIKMYQIAGIKF